MSSASASPHGFDTQRGRGYRPEQVDRQVSELSRLGDEAWERVARLEALAEELAARAARLREEAAALPRRPMCHWASGRRAC